MYFSQIKTGVARNGSSRSVGGCVTGNCEGWIILNNVKCMYVEFKF